MAINAIVIKNLYNPDYENLDPQDLQRRSLSGGFQGDAAVKAAGKPQYTVTFNTTDATAGEVYLSIGNAVNTRSVVDTESSPSNLITRVIGGVDVTSVAFVRKITLEVSQNIAGVRNFARFVGVFRNAATPTAQTDFALKEGALSGASAIAATTFAAGQINLTVTGIAATSINWTVGVIAEDLR